MNLKILLFFSVFGFNLYVVAYPIQAVVIKPKAVTPKEEDSSIRFVFIDEKHAPEPSLSTTDHVIGVFQKSENHGNSVHVLIEAASPIAEYYCKKDRHLLTDLPKRGKNELPGTPIEDIDPRKKTGIATYIWREADPTKFLTPFTINELKEAELTAYLGKDIWQVTLKDLYDELKAMKKTARQVKKLCKDESELAKLLSAKIGSFKKHYKEFRNMAKASGFASDRRITEKDWPDEIRKKLFNLQPKALIFIYSSELLSFKMMHRNKEFLKSLPV